MTTIAFCGRYLAADTMALRDNIPSNREYSKLHIADGFAYAVSGDWGPVIADLIKWHQDGAKPADIPQHGGGSLTVIELVTGRVWALSGPQMPYLDEETAPWVCGSGGDIALGAMGAGKTAMEAAQIAARWDIKTGGPIDFIDLEWPEKGVQRWDGLIPSSRFPMPVQTMGVDDPSDNLPVEAAKISEWYTKDMGRKHNQRLNLSDLDDILARWGWRDGDAYAHEYVEVRAHGENYGKCLLSFRRSLREHLDGKQGVLVWRIRPEMGLDTDGVWCAYCRFAIVPDVVEDADEEGNPRVSLAHELVHTQHAGGVIGRSDICEHGYVRSTCSRCVAKAVAEVRDAQANGHA